MLGEHHGLIECSPLCHPHSGTQADRVAAIWKLLGCHGRGEREHVNPCVGSSSFCLQIIHSTSAHILRAPANWNSAESSNPTSTLENKEYYNVLVNDTNLTSYKSSIFSLYIHHLTCILPAILPILFYLFIFANFKFYVFICKYVSWVWKVMLKQLTS